MSDWTKCVLTVENSGIKRSVTGRQIAFKYLDNFLMRVGFIKKINKIKTESDCCLHCTELMVYFCVCLVFTDGADARRETAQTTAGTGTRPN